MKLDGNKKVDQEILDGIEQELTYESSSEEGSHSGSESESEYSSNEEQKEVEDTPKKTMEVEDG